MDPRTASRPSVEPADDVARIVMTAQGVQDVRRGARLVPRMLGLGRLTLLRAQAGPLAGDHDRVEIVVESGTLTVEPVAANVALPGLERTVLKLDVSIGPD